MPYVVIRIGKVVINGQNTRQYPQKEKERAEAAKESEGFERSEKSKDLPQHAEAVVKGSQLTYTPNRSLPVRNVYLHNLPPVIEHLQGHFCLDFEPRGDNRQKLDDVAVKGSITTHDVCKFRLTNPIDETPNKIVSK